MSLRCVFGLYIKMFVYIKYFNIKIFKSLELQYINFQLIRYQHKMSSKTPVKFPNGNTSYPNGRESEIVTPFKERALEEQRLREALMLSLTPGLKRRLEIQESVEPLHNDPHEIRLYLRDLGLALASQGKNLTSQLDMAAEKNDEFSRLQNGIESIQEEGKEKQQSINEDIQWTVEDSLPIDKNIDKNIEKSGEQEPHSYEDEHQTLQEDTTNASPTPLKLSDLIFSELQTVSRKVKVRKLEPVEIKEVALKPLNEALSTGNTFPHIIDNNDIPSLQIPKTPSPNPVDMNNTIATNIQDIQDFPMDIGNDDPEEEGKDKDIITTPKESRRGEFSLDRTDSLIFNSMNQNDKVSTINTHAQGTLFREESYAKNTFNVPENLIDDGGTIITDYSVVLDYFLNRELVPRDITISKDILYEICCKYLPLEQVDAIEKVWYQ